MSIVIFYYKNIVKSYISNDYVFIEPKFLGTLSKIKYPVLAQIKYDGELCMAKISNGECRLYSRPHIGRIRTSCPITDELLSINTSDAIFLGELYYGDGTNAVQFLMHKVSDALKYAIFDVVTWDGNDVCKIPFRERLSLLRHVTQKDHIHIADSLTCYNSSQLDNFYSESLDRGYEGVVIRSEESIFNKDYISKDTVVWCNDAVSILPIIGFSKNNKKLSLLLGCSDPHKKDKAYPLSQCKVFFSNSESEQLRNFLQHFIAGETEANYLIYPYIMAEVKHGGVLRFNNGRTHSLRSPELIQLLPNAILDDQRL